MAIVNGVVSTVNNNFGKFNMQVNGNWYNTKPEWLKATPVVGDTVEFDDGGSKYIKNLRVLGAGSAPAASKPQGSAPVASTGRSFPVGALAPERTINRQNALTNAVAYTKSADVSPEQVIEVARMFEAYTTGDLDAQEAEEAFKQLGV